ncbi:hypothetical protein JMM63_21445, partial [Rhodovulum sulfidophilum]
LGKNYIWYFTEIAEFPEKINGNRRSVTVSIPSTQTPPCPRQKIRTKYSPKTETAQKKKAVRSKKTQRRTTNPTGVVAQISLRPDGSRSRCPSRDGLDLGSAEGVEAVHE